MNRLHNKDFSIAFKTGSDADRLKFKKEAVQGELYFAVDSQTLYVAEATAGISDATLSQFSASTAPTFTINIFDTEENILSRTGDDTGTVAYGTDTNDLYVLNNENFNKWSHFEDE